MLGILKLTLRSNTPSQTLANTKNVQEVLNIDFNYTQKIYIYLNIHNSIGYERKLIKHQPHNY